MFYLSLIGAVLIIVSIVSGGLIFRDAVTGLILLSVLQSFYSLGIIIWIVALAKKYSRPGLK